MIKNGNMTKVQHLIILAILGELPLSLTRTIDGKVHDFGKYAFEHLEFTNSHLDISGCVRKAIDTATRFSRGFSNITLAITWVNLYSQDCEYTDPDDKSKGLFYRRLNEELRTPSQRSISQWFIESGQVINMALDVLGPRHEKVLYRGDTFEADFNRSSIIRRDFTSTTKDCETAIGFCCDSATHGDFIILLEATGTYVSDYSHFGGEEEVLLKAGSRFKVETVKTNKTEIIDRVAVECEMNKEMFLEFIMKKNYGIPKRLVLLMYDPSSFD